jgi:large subunit ribosomal protein L21
MAKIAVIHTGGKQYKVKEGETVKIEKLDKEVNSKVKFETLLIADGDNVQIGTPSLGDKVEGEIIKSAKDKKITVVRFKSKVRYKKITGHRQPYMAVKITAIA